MSRPIAPADLARAVRDSQGRLGAFACVAEPGPRPEGGALRGTPIAVKDVIDVAGLPTGLGTPGAGHRRPTRDARVVAALLDAGAFVVGKTVTHELALGVTTPGVGNPFDLDRMAGGSSGGSAAAVAAGLVPVALGTDTSGSTRCPAALCGVVGLKPTIGALSTEGVAPLAPTQDCVGIVAASVRQCADVFHVLREGPGEERSLESVSGLRVGVDVDVYRQTSSSDVLAAIRRSGQELEQAGAELVLVRHGGFTQASATSVIVMFHEAAGAWGGVLAEQPAGFSPRVRGALRAGALIAPQTYERALRSRERLRAASAAVFRHAGLDALLTPTVAVTAPPTGARTVVVNDRPQSVDAALTRFTSLASVTGQPAISVPCGLDRGGLPIGLQLIGRPGGEDVLLALAAGVQRTAGAEAVAAARRLVMRRFLGVSPSDRFDCGM